MRFRIKNGGSARQFMFEREAKPEHEPAAPAPRAADLDNPYGRYYTTARSREQLQAQRHKD